MVNNIKFNEILVCVKKYLVSKRNVRISIYSQYVQMTILRT